MPDALLQAAELARQGQLDAAIRAYEAILAGQPGQSVALAALARLLLLARRPERAVEILQPALAGAADPEGLHTLLAEARRGLGDYAAALEAAQAALRLAPDEPDALLQAGLSLHALGRREEAMAHFSRVIAANPAHAAAQNQVGVLHGEMGQPARAEAAFGRALEVEPAYVPALVNLGRMLLGQGRLSEALPHLEQAVRHRPDLAEVRRNLGNVWHGLGRFAEAKAEYLEALARDPQLDMALVNLALVHEHLGDLDQALVPVRQALARQPQNLVFWQQLAELHEKRLEPLVAQQCWQKMLTLEPQNPRGHVALGRALHKLGRQEQAAAQYRRALDLQPDLVDAYDYLAKLHQELGEPPEAEAALRASNRLRPQGTAAQAALAMLLGGRLPDEELQALRRRAAEAALDPVARAHLLFALAHVCDARGEYSAAAENARLANGVALGIAARLGRAYVPEQHVRFVDGLIAEFSPRFLERTRGGGLSNRRPVFVFGLPRSGTSMVEQILASHPAVHGAGELLVAAQSFDSIPTLLGRGGSPLASVADLDLGAISRLASRHLDSLDSFDPGRHERIVDKAPQNYQFVPLLAAMFPRATFIHCRRDLRDVALSCFLTQFEQVTWSQHVDHIASHFQQYRRLMERWQALLPRVIHEVHYEQTVGDLEGTARALVSACGLEWHPGCLEFHLTRRAVRTQSAVQVRQPVYTRSVGRWKHYAADLADLFAQLPMD